MKITEYIKDNILLFDGGMGTMLQGRGLRPGELPETWNTEHPEAVTAIHREYVAAGARVVTSNTFGANIYKYEGKKLEKLIRAGLSCAREAAGTDNFVALDIGPLGKLVGKPGGISFEEAVSAFSATVRAASEDADLILIETMNDLYELKAAILAAKENSSLPIFATVVLDAEGRMLGGADVGAVVALAEGLGVSAIGMNCSLGPAQMKKLLPAMLEISSVPVIVRPNAGLPRIENGRTVYDVTPEEFAELVAQMAASGAHGVGGCCGTTPEYISLLAEKLKKVVPTALRDKKYRAVSSQYGAVRVGRRPLLIGERINPTGKAKIKEALKSGDYSYIISEGLSEEECGADILDVNAGLPGIDEGAALTRIVCDLQALTRLPLQIDTADAAAMESAMRVYCGIPLVNSVNGKKESMDAVFPLVKKYGGLVIALTLDEGGIPETADERVKIAERIAAEAKKYGIDSSRIIFDPLALSVSAKPDAALVTLDAIKELTARGYLTSLGVSNISFGLPGREIINSVFFTLALSAGLSMAIMNPKSVEMKKAYRAFLALTGKDANFTEYIAFASEIPQDTAQTTAAVSREKPKDEPETHGRLGYAVIHGLAAEAAEAADALLREADGLEVINSHIIPALGEVGEGFEKQKIFLPQLLMAAEAATAAFDRVKKSMGGEKTKTAGKVVLATVKGDIHDIGKNIVRVLLENYGFEVIDLGRDVSYETILSAARESGARLVGLSALMTTTLPAMKESVEAVHRELPGVKVVVGGAVLTEEYARELGADYYAKDATETVRVSRLIYGL